MNPSQAAQLLNPKAFAKEQSKKKRRTPNYGPQQARKPASTQQNGQNTTTSNTPQFDPRALLNPRAAASKAGGAGTQDEDAKRVSTLSGDAADMQMQPRGMGSMIEQMHGVSNRESIPQHRKRKSEAKEEEDDTKELKKPKSSFNGMASGGELGQYMKDERKKHAEAHGPSTAPIDLTADDGDDDLVITGQNPRARIDPTTEEVCCGVLGCKATISRIPVTSQKALPEYWPRTKLRVRREIATDIKVDLVDREGHRCGYLEYKVASVLCPLLNGQQTNKIRLEAYLETHRRVKNEHVGQAVSKTLNLSLLIYAPENRTGPIGKQLSQRQLFLTSPGRHGLNVGKRICNPHDIKHVHGPTALMGTRQPQPSQGIVGPSLTIEEVQTQTNKMFDQLVKHEDIPEREPVNGLIYTELMPHQKQALHFLIDHENLRDDQDASDSPNYSLWRSRVDKKGRENWYNVVTPQVLPEKPEPVRGGILADMMGLGKTLSILSLVAETRQEASSFLGSQPPAESHLELNSKATLIVCPKSVMSNWTEQIRTHCNEKKLRSYTYHGSSRTDDLEELASCDIVLTTYNTAASELSGQGKPLAAINWFRVVLDEAHQIRNQATQVSKGCCALAAQRRWAVTGTPVQNGLGDLGSLIKFLRVKPFDEGVNWTQYIVTPFRQGTTETLQKLRLLVDSITLRRMKDKIDLKDRKVYNAVLEFPEKDRKIYEQLANDSGKQLHLMTGGAKNAALKGKAYAHVLKSLGRLRAFCAHGLDMFSDEDRKDIMEGMNPENAIAVELDDEPEFEEYKVATEKQAYETLQLMSDTDADRCERCNKKISEENSEVAETSEDEDDKPHKEDSDDIIGYLNSCYHIFCPGCKDKYIEQCQSTLTVDQRHNCPCCEAYIRLGLFTYHRSTLREHTTARLVHRKTKRNQRAARNYETTYDGPSAKVSALLRALDTSAAETLALPPGEPPIRSVVFSGWTTFLDLIEIALEDHNVGFLRLDGSMSIRQRTAVLTQFQTDPNITLLLVSIKAGGQGLNFTAANKVYMMEPQYNPGVEDQAIDRVHRLGQRRDVEIVHFVMEGSVEGRIQKLQTRKKQLANFTLERKLSRKEEAEERIRELKDLFR
ncbi:hypothetical protein B0A50_06594 [Salinomyces thailandicus]|uniref:Uncharacterized protein n=1 Tax=Salinomyces thailandicus TaxID=706561 RepID=A0A4U0TST0_9PEZI|nr:hypothetical protein B0A50_06594 [Salinomyces thailandica]